MLTKITIATATLGALLATANTSFACKGNRGERKRALLQKMDLNEDGALDRTELTQGFYNKARERLQKADTNGDGLADKSELKALHQAKREARGERQDRRAGKRFKGKSKRHQKRFARVDANGDGRLSLAEMQSAADQRISRMFERMDANLDGVLSADELSKHRPRRKKS